jgi:hypothetical protein
MNETVHQHAIVLRGTARRPGGTYQVRMLGHVQHGTDYCTGAHRRLRTTFGHFADGSSRMESWALGRLCGADAMLRLMLGRH